MNGKTLSGIQAANTLAKEFSEISNVKVNKDQQSFIRQEEQTLNNSDMTQEMSVLLKERELKMALRKPRKY